MDYAAVFQTAKRLENKIKKDRVIYEVEKTMTKALEYRRKVEFIKNKI